MTKPDSYLAESANALELLRQLSAESDSVDGIEVCEHLRLLLKLLQFELQARDEAIRKLTRERDEAVCECALQSEVARDLTKHVEKVLVDSLEERCRQLEAISDVQAHLISAQETIIFLKNAARAQDGGK